MDYLVRVELHGASYANYDTLHRAMEARGFSRTIRSGEGTIYQLPTAEYTISTSQVGESVRTQAAAAAAATGCAHAILVVNYAEAWWTGLSKTRAA